MTLLPGAFWLGGLSALALIGVLRGKPAAIYRILIIAFASGPRGHAGSET